MIERNKYLNELIKSMKNGFPKVITGIRRCGKSYLLNPIFTDYLKKNGIEESQIIIIELDDINNTKYRNPFKLTEFVKSQVTDSKKDYYVFIDEIQLVSKIINPEFTNGEIILAKENDENVISFVDVVLGLSRIPNVDLYVTGSNSKLLSKDIVTEFRDKATNISIGPVSFDEFHNYKKGYVSEDLMEYIQYGGMPLAILKEGKEKKDYLQGLYKTTYFKDIIDRNKLYKSEALEELAKIISSCVGSLINVEKIVNTYKSIKHENIDKVTVDKYIGYFVDSFILEEATRYDLKGRCEIGALRKYYYADCGLRNAVLNFAYMDIGQLLENLVYNELIYNGYSVNVGSFESYGKNKDNKTIRQTNEVDFYAVRNNRYLYIQVSENLESAETKKREIKPYLLLNDQIQKIVVINRPLEETRDENGFTIIGIVDFLLRFIK